MYIYSRPLRDLGFRVCGVGDGVALTVVAVKSNKTDVLTTGSGVVGVRVDTVVGVSS